MKKYFFIAVAAVVAMASCSKVEADLSSVPEKKIDFQVANYMAQTKAGETALQSEFTKFYTIAKFFPEYGDKQTYMDGVEIVFTEGTDGAKNVWAPARDYYWPKTGYINFYSYVNTENQNPLIEFNEAWTVATAEYANKTIGATDNILLADAALMQNGNLTTYTAISGVTSGVPTLFRHLLAKINFTIQLKTTEDKVSSSTKFVVTVLNEGDNLSNLVVEKVGSFTATNDFGTTAEATVKPWTMPNVWTVPETGSAQETIDMQTLEMTLPVGEDEIDAVSLLDERTVMPQTLGEVENFKLSYKVETYYGEETTPYMTEIFRIDAPIVELVDEIEAWNKNTKITYNIIIDPIGNKITFDPAVEAWNEVEGTYNYPEE